MKKLEKLKKWVLYFFSILFILAGLAYIMNDARVSIFFIMGGILIFPVFVNFILKKINNNKINKRKIYIAGFIFIIIGLALIPKQFIVIKSNKDALVDKMDFNDGKVQYYGIESVEVSLAPSPKMDFLDYIKDDKQYERLIKILKPIKNYEDNSVLYRDSNDIISLLICGNKSKEENIIVGDENLEFQKGFCGSETIPNEKENKDKTKEENNETDKANNNTKEENDSNDDNDNYNNIKGLSKKGKNNLVAALKECNINPSNIKSFKEVNEWSNGTRYSFTYKGDKLWVYMYDDDTVSSINLSLGGLHLYDEKYESLDYENYHISSETASLMEIRAEEQIDIYLKDASSAKYNWSSYQRTNEYLGISGTVESNNSFGQKVKSSVFVAFKLQEDMLSLIYVEINGTGVYGTKVSVEVPRVERKVENTSTDNSITLKDGTLGTYGKYDIMDGNQYIRYYIPNGKYKVTALVKNSMFYVESIAIHKENGYDTPTTYNTINLKNKNDTQNIEITDGQCISLVMGTRIKLEKIN